MNLKGIPGGTVLVVAAFWSFRLCAQSPPSPDVLTEYAAAHWEARAAGAWAEVYDDATRLLVGKSSLRFETTGGFDTWLWAPMGRNANWDLRFTTALRFFVYAENPSPYDFQNASPWVRFGTGPGAFDYWQLQSDAEALNPAVGNWIELVIPVGGDSKWQRTTVGNPDLSDIDYIEIHADTWDYGFALWIDGLTFDPLPYNPTGVSVLAGDSAISVQWNSYVVRPDFGHFAIYRDQVPFSSVAGMQPITTLTDPNTTAYDDRSVVNGQAYYYAVTAVRMDSSEDTEVTAVGPRIPGPSGEVRLTGFFSTVWADWDPVVNPDVAGYVVFRRAEGGLYPPQPSKRVLVRSSFTDYGLTPGQTYVYKVAAIDGEGHQITAFTDEVSTTLATEPSVFNTHKNLELLMAFYTGGFTPDEVNRMTEGLRKGLEFYWRTSRGRLNLDVTWLFIDAETPGSITGWDNLALQADLRARGVQNDQFDLAYLVGMDLPGCLGGYVVFGSTCASLGTVCGVPYPENNPDVDYTIAWTFTHEIHHALEAMQNRSGPSTPEVLFCHFPWTYPEFLGPTGVHLDWGPHFDGIAQTNRVYEDQWMSFPAPYDGYIETLDADGDGLPDQDGRVPVDEIRFGSKSESVDTDDDGLNDLAEFSAYNFRGTDPTNVDTDHDGLSDGDDHQPLYRAARYVPLADPPPRVDGVLNQTASEWKLPIEGYFFTQNSWDFPLTTYVAFEPMALYFAFVSDRPLRFKISIDGSGADGRFESPVRHVSGATNTFDLDNKHNHFGDSWGDGNHIYTSFGSATVGVFERGPIPGARVASALSLGSSYTTELRIPRVLPAGSAFTWYPPSAPVTDGLTLNPGHQIGLNVTCSERDDSDDSEFSGTWTSVFETHSFVDFTLQYSGDADLDGDFDLRDFSAFQRCFGPMRTGCRIADSDVDQDVDLGDYAGFNGTMTGPQ